MDVLIASNSFVLAFSSFSVAVASSCLDTN
uniref:Uncharacterized protein n=1 Tax=Arundo donax TaxID=35708 RepID=A0A0A9CIM8_ARUDO